MIWHVRWSYVLSKLYGRLRLCHTHFTWHMTDSVSDTDWQAVTATFIDTATDGKLLSLLWMEINWIPTSNVYRNSYWKYIAVLFCANTVNYNFVSFIDRQMTSLVRLQRRRGSLITQQAVSTRHGRSNTRSVMPTMPGHLEGWRQMQLRHCGVVRWTDTNSDTRLSCPTATQKHINICALWTCTAMTLWLSRKNA